MCGPGNGLRIVLAAVLDQEVAVCGSEAVPGQEGLLAEPVVLGNGLVHG
jgi:hypothetical protein